jgi:hypothetical protein
MRPPSQLQSIAVFQLLLYPLLYALSTMNNSVGGSRMNRAKRTGGKIIATSAAPAKRKPLKTLSFQGFSLGQTVSKRA